MHELGHIDAKKSLGQHFLSNPKVPEWMADAADLKAGETVLEIGPGTGMLTREFLKRGAKIIAVETDARAIELLTETFQKDLTEGKLVLKGEDIRGFNPAENGLVKGQYKIIANIPYYISGLLFRQFLESDCQPNTLVFLIQKEVAQRIARDERESLMSLGVKAYGQPRYVKTVSKGNFQPMPKVDSAIVSISDISKKNFRNVPETLFFELLHLGFASKRKQLLGNLSKKYPRETLTAVFKDIHLKEDVRAEDIPLQTWLTLAEKLK